MSPTITEIEEQAVAWVIRLRDPAFADWETFEVWLSGDPSHASIYHSMAAADADLGEMIQPTTTMTPPIARLASRRRWMAAGLAVALAGLIGYSAFPGQRDLYAVETAAGKHRTVELDGSQIALNGATSIALDRRDVRYATLNRGQAMFTVRHDPARPFKVEVGGVTLVDAGTAFEVTREKRTLEVAVKQGLVIYNPGREGVRLAAGTGLRTGDADSQLSLTRLDPERVGAWRQGRLDYDGATMERISADLARNLGIVVQAAPAVSSLQFRGVISLDGGPDTVMARVGPVLGVVVTRTGQAWMLTERR
jgi:transmembrane sensor